MVSGPHLDFHLDPHLEPLLVVLAGPTASGKSALAVQLAEHLNGEVLSCDSVAVYRGMDIGSAKPTAAERARVPHHMLDVATPAAAYTAGDYSRDARTVLADLKQRGKTPIVTGGTGLYLRALLEGLSPVPPRDEALRDRLRRSIEAHGELWLHRLLTRLDPAAAARIHPNDESKLLRAVEVSVLARRPITETWSAHRAQPLTGFRIVQLMLSPPREALYSRINARAAAMFANGLVDETRNLITHYGEGVHAMNALGYAQARAELREELTRDEAITAAQQGHRNYAKRQLTWFRRIPQMHWIETFGDTSFNTAKNLLH